MCIKFSKLFTISTLYCFAEVNLIYRHRAFTMLRSCMCLSFAMLRSCMCLSILCMLTVAVNTENNIKCASTCNPSAVYMSYRQLVNRTKVVKDFENGPLSVDLSHSNLINITKDVKDIIPWLISLDLSHNNITYLGQDVFKNASCLLRLNLRHNNIRRLPPELLGSPGQQMRIKEFDVSHNNITTVDPDLFHEGLVYLKIVNISYNNLEYFEPWPYRLKPLEEINGCTLNRNLSHYTNEFALTVDGYIFDLSHNKIDECRNEKDIRITKQYYKVNMSSNNINDVVECLKTLTGLNTSIINLRTEWEDNPIICDCRMHQLTQIVKDSTLTSLSKKYLTCQNPYQLENKTFGEITKNAEVLQCNVTNLCPLGCFCVWTPAKKLLTVDCSMVNTFTELPMVLPESMSILLNMSGNKLVRLVNRQYIPYLFIVDVSFNQIASIDVDFFGKAKRMRYINMSHNLITTLPISIRNLNFSRVRLENNALECSCDSRWIKNWIQSANAGVLHKHSLNCDVGGSRQNVTVALNNLKCDIPSTLIVIVCSVLGIFATVSIIIIFIACVWKYETNVLTNYMCGIRPFKVEESETQDSIADQGTNYEYDVFISCDINNSEVTNWINRDLLPWCRKQRKPLKCYCGFRDEPIGVEISDLMTKNLEKSRKILLVVDDHYHQGGWCMDVVSMAHSIHYHKTLVLLFHCPENFNNEESEQIKSYISQKRYIKLGESLFWPKLYYEIWER